MKKVKPLYSFKALCALASKEIHRPELQCIRFEADGRVTATDSYVLASVRSERLGIRVRLNAPLSLPVSMFKNIKVTDVLDGELDDEVILYDDADHAFRLKRSEHSLGYPDYKQIVPSPEALTKATEKNAEWRTFDCSKLSKLMDVFGTAKLDLCQVGDMLVVTEQDDDQAVGLLMACIK